MVVTKSVVVTRQSMAPDAVCQKLTKERAEEKKRGGTSDFELLRFNASSTRVLVRKTDFYYKMTVLTTHSVASLSTGDLLTLWQRLFHLPPEWTPKRGHGGPHVH